MKLHNIIQFSSYTPNNFSCEHFLQGVGKAWHFFAISEIYHHNPNPFFFHSCQGWNGTSSCILSLNVIAAQHFSARPAVCSLSDEAMKNNFWNVSTILRFIEYVQM